MRQDHDLRPRRPVCALQQTCPCDASWGLAVADWETSRWAKAGRSNRPNGLVAGHHGKLQLCLRQRHVHEATGSRMADGKAEAES